ncbi:CshA/CshB family fibrillar adhesin-related protein [Microbacterium tumbae]
MTGTIRLGATRRRRIPAMTAVFALLAGLVVVGGPLLTASPAQARYATGGEGLYQESIDWFEWGAAGEAIPAAGLTRTNTRTVAGQTLATTCTISNLQGALQAYRSGDWSGDGLDDLYNIGGTGTANQLIAGLRNTTFGALVNFRFSCAVTLDGVPVPLQGLVIADAEQSGVTGSGVVEYVQARPEQPATWRVVDRYRDSACTSQTNATLSADSTLRFSIPSAPGANPCPTSVTAGGPMAIGFMQGATSAQVALQGGGVSAIALGVVLQTDFGDAPASYGAAGALFEPAWQGGTLSVGTTPVSGPGFALGVPGQPATRLGATVDAESVYTPSPDASADDTDGGADEDAISPPGTITVTPGETYTLEDVQCTGPGYVTGWIDWNHNGTFDEGEQSGVVQCTGSPVDLTWTVPADTVPAVGADQTFLRLRIAADDVAVSSPTGMTTSGEVEDYALNVALPALSIEKSSDATADARPGDTVTYTVTATNTGESDYTSDFPAVVFDDLSAVLDDATYNNNGSANQPGPVSYASPLLSWTGALGVGESVELTYTVTLKAGGDGVVRNVAWAPNDPENPEPPVCDPPEDGIDPVTGEPCAEVEFPLPRLTIEKTADRTELPAVGETVEYTVTVTNVGPGVYTADAPATATDDLLNVLDAATFNDDATSSTGTVSYDEPTLSWSGALEANESATITYTVTYTGEGDQNLRNLACVPTSETAPGEQSCDFVQIPGAGLTQWKQVQASATPAVAGTVLTYTLFFNNDGEAAADLDAVDDLTHVTDDADVTTEPTSADGLAVSRDGNRISISGSVPGGETYTVTYQVTVKADGERGDDTAANFLLAPDEEPPTDPECEPSDEQFPDCTTTPIAAVVYSKSVSADSDPVVAGTVLTYTVTVENTGTATSPVSREDVLTDVLDDADLTSDPVSDTDSVTVSAVTDGRFSIAGELAAGQTALITYQVTVKPDAERGNNQADNFLVPPGGTPEGPCEENDPTCTSTPIPLIEASKSSDPESGSVVTAGQEVTYTLTFTNSGEAAGPVDYTDNLADVLDDATLTAGPTASNDALEVTQDGDALLITGSLDPDQTVTVTYTVTVSADADRKNNRLGNVLADSDITDPECGDDGVSCTEHPIPELVSWKAVEADTTPVAAGTVLTYTLSFENTGQGAATVDEVDDLTHVTDDADVTTEPTSADGLTVTRDGNRISITGDVPAGETFTVTYQVTVKADGERGDDIAANFLLPPDQEPPTDPECEPADGERPDCTVTPIGAATYEKAVSASSDPVEAGTVLTYTITIRNTGEGPITVSREDVLTDVLDDADLISDPVSDTDSVTVSDVTDGRFQIGGELAGGATAVVTYEVTVNEQVDRGNNSAANFLVPPGETPPEECVPTEGQLPDCTVTPLPEIDASKSSDPESGTTVTAGQEVTYTLTFVNNGNGSGTVDYTDNLTGVFDDATLTAGPTASDEALTAALNGDDTLHVTGVLGAGQTVTVSYTVTVLPDGQRGDNRLGNVLAPTGTTDPECGDDGVSCTEHPVPELESWKGVEVDTTPVAAGTVLTYTLYFENVGEGAGTVNEVDDLTHVTDDADVTAEPTSADGLTVSRDGNRISITGEVPAGETYTVTYQVTVKADGERGDDIAANFLLPPDEEPPTDPVCQPEDGERPDCTVTPIGMLLTGKSVSADSDPVDVGTVLMYTLTFDNQGEGPIAVDHTDILTDVLDDADLTSDPVASDDALSVTAVESGSFTVTGELAAGQTVTVTYQVTVKEEADRGNNTADNFLVPTGEEPPEDCVEGDPNCTVTPLPLVEVSKSADPETGSDVQAGQEVTYTLTFTNSGDAAGPVDYTDNLAQVLDDADLTGAPVSSDPALVPSSGEDGLVRVTGTLAPDQTVTVSYTVTVKPDGDRGDNRLRNVVAKTGTEDPQCGDDGVSCTEHPVGELDDWKTVDPTTGSTLRPGETATYTLHFENTGNAPVEVNRDDVLTKVLDDADVTAQPVASSDALTVSAIENGRFTITGTLQPGEQATVTYTVTVKADGQRGDDRLDNFLVPNGEEPPETCVPADGERPDCTYNHVSDVSVEKSSDPESGSEVSPGEEVTYTLTFTNRGTNPDAADVAVDYTDHMADVLDDATLTGGPTVSNGNLTATAEGDTIRITGAVPTGQIYTVTYTVTVNAYDTQGNHQLGNVVAITGEEPLCVPDSPLCTEHEVPEPPTPGTPPGPGGFLPNTGAQISVAVILAALLLLGAGGGLVVVGRRRKTAAISDREVRDVGIDDLF